MRLLLAMESTVTRVVFERRLRALEEGPRLLVESVDRERALGAARAEDADLIIVDSPLVGDPPLAFLTALRAANPTIALAVATWRPHHVLDAHTDDVGYSVMLAPFPEDEVAILCQRALALRDRWAERELRYAG